MAQLALHILAVASILAGLAAITLRILPPSRAPREAGRAWWLAGLILTAAFVLYVEVILLGSFGQLRPLPLVLANLAAAAILAGPARRELPALARVASGAVAGGPEAGARRLVLFLVFFTAFLNLASTLPSGDFLSYHLANVLNFTTSGSTATVDPSLWPLTAPLFYPRGMEAILAPFFLFDLLREGAFLFGALGVAVLYLSLREAAGHRSWADLIFVLLLSTGTLQENLLEIKNDLVVGSLALFLLAPLLSGRASPSTPWLPLAAATGLLLAVKANGAPYAALALAAWAAPRPRLSLRSWARLLAVALPAGLYFYAANLLQTGHLISPVDGGDLAATTLLGNLDGALPLHLLRGALVALGPAGLILAAAGIPFAFAAAARREGPGGDGRPAPPALILLLAAALALWMATPYSDNTGLRAHSSLFSGHALRFACPFLFLAAALAGGRLASRRPGGPARAVVAAAGAAMAADLFGYDLAALALKPANAFAALAPVVRTFSNAALAGTALLVAAAAAILARRPARTAVAGFLLAGAVLFHLGWPGSLGWSLRFKQLGAPTTAFTALDGLGGPGASVAIHRRINGALQSGVDYLLAWRFARVELMEDPARPPGAGVLIYAVEATTAIAGMVEGRRTRLSWEYMEGVTVPEGYGPVLEDPYFRIWSRSAPSGSAAGP